jgi:hypothetical protein
VNGAVLLELETMLVVVCVITFVIVLSWVDVVTEPGRVDVTTEVVTTEVGFVAK